MTLYGDFDDQYRPRPAWWRFATVGFCQTLFSIWLATALVSVVDSYVFHMADVKDYFALYVPPWQTLKGEFGGSVLLRSAGSDLPLRYEQEFAKASLPAAAVLAGLGVVVAFFWPTRQTLARRLFVLTLGPALTLFGAALLLNRGSVSGVSRSSFIPYAALGVAALVTIAAETRAIQLLSNFYAMREPSRRVGYWFLRYVPAFAAVGGSAYFARSYETCIYSAGFLLVTLFMNLVHTPRDHFEQVEAIELREAAAALLFLAVILAGGAVWLFRFQPPRRAIALADDRAKIVLLSDVPRELLAHWKPPAPPPPKIDIRWSKRPGRITQ
ncbi:MAG TPA: hypothetical protein VFL80_11305 [Thermoanaerobaculia bacterium]|nr:hypothetical protein [Thermoanaerobaculia bacterium]